MSAEELADLRQWLAEEGNPIETWKKHKRDRRSRNVKPLCLTALRKALKGKTYRGGPETRGAKRKLGPRAIKALNKKRRQLVDKRCGEQEVGWVEVIKKSRVKKVHPTTAKRNLRAAGIPVASRRNREKPHREKDHIKERWEVCGRWRFLPKGFFNTKVDLIMDNKLFEVPTSDGARRFKRKMKVRHQIRTRSEGLEPNYTKPNPKRNRRNLGGLLQVCGGIRNDRIVLWKYIEGKWNGDVAAKIYDEDIRKLFKRLCPEKASPTIVEDNDPTGYKSSKAIAVKKRLKYNIMSLPRSSPDLNPLDFSIWTDIERRMMKTGPKKRRETVHEYKIRLRKTAMTTSRALVRKAVANMHERAVAIYHAKGNHIDLD